MLKISGESLAGSNEQGFDFDILNDLANSIKTLQTKNLKISMKSVLQIVIVFFAGILIAQILYSFGLSIDVSMMGGTAGILTLAFLVTKQNNKNKKK